MTTPGPASFAGRRDPARTASRGGEARPYPPFAEDADVRDLALAATRALVSARDTATVRRVVRTVVHDLGGALVPARLDPADALPLDVSLGLGDPELVVVEPLSVASLRLGQVLPALVEDARAAAARLVDASTVVPGTDQPGPDVLPRFLGLVSVADTAGARALVSRLVRAGVAPDALVERVLAPAQREVGDRWYRAEWSVADEHAATAVTDAAASVLPVSTSGPLVVVASPAGEWHTLPGRLAAASARGVRTTVLGPGLPADHLERYLDAAAPDLLALSVTMSTNLVAAAEAVRAAHQAGVPVVAGGRAFGRDDRRARRLGADAWAASATELARLATGLLPRDDEVEVHPEALLADAVADEVLLLALERQSAAAPWVREMDSLRRAAALDDLRWIARHGAAALACEDPSVLEDLLGWLDALLRDRGVPARALPDSARYLADALEPETPAVAALVAGAASRLA